MKAKKLISELQKLVDENGDLEVDFVSSFLNCSCGESVYCYCTTEDYSFTIESVNKRVLPRCGKMATIGLAIRGSKD